jgi:hypothetical protein
MKTKNGPKHIVKEKLLSLSENRTLVTVDGCQFLFNTEKPISNSR